MDKPGGHRTGLNAHFGVDTSVLRNTSRNWPGIGGADAAPEPLALRVDNADRGRLLRYVQPNIMRHRNLRWCKSPGKMPGSRHYRCLRLRTAITRGPQMLHGYANPLKRLDTSKSANLRKYLILLDSCLAASLRSNTDPSDMTLRYINSTVVLRPVRA